MKKNLVMKIQNLVVNHESQPVKSNPDIHIFYIFHIFNIFLMETD